MFVYMYVLVAVACLVVTVAVVPADDVVSGVHGSNLSIIGRYGQNDLINGEYVLNGTSADLPYYIKASHGSDPELYLFAHKNDVQNIWAVGEQLSSLSDIRAFVVSDAREPQDISPSQVWRVFESLINDTVVPVPDKYIAITDVSCSNTVRDNQEEGADCGGPCRECASFSNCEGLRVPKTYTLGSCNPEGTLKHGETCEYECPLSFVTSGRQAVRCYDGVNDRLAETGLCRPVFAASICPYLELQIETEGTPAQCNGVYRSFKSETTDIKPVLWYRTDDETGRQDTLFWHEGVWSCITSSSNERLGHMPMPINMEEPLSDPAFTGVGFWRLGDGSVEQLPATINCTHPGDKTCKIIRTFEWPMIGSTSLNGVWLNTGQTINDRKVFSLRTPPGAAPIYSYWSENSNWLIDTDFDDSAFLAYQPSFNMIPISGSWYFLRNEEWETENLSIYCVTQSNRMVRVTEESLVRQDPDAGLDLESWNEVVSLEQFPISAIKSFTDELDAPRASFNPQPTFFAVPPLSLQDFTRGEPLCTYARLIGALSAYCNGYWTAGPTSTSSPSSPAYWYRLTPSGAILYLYRTSGVWVCTDNGDTSVLGYVTESSNNYPSSVFTVNGTGGVVESVSKWATDGEGFQETRNLKFGCVAAEDIECDTFDVSGFGVQDLNGKYVASPQDNMWVNTESDSTLSLNEYGIWALDTKNITDGRYNAFHTGPFDVMEGEKNWITFAAGKKVTVAEVDVKCRERTMKRRLQEGTSSGFPLGAVQVPPRGSLENILDVGRLIDSVRRDTSGDMRDSARPREDGTGLLPATAPSPTASERSSSVTINQGEDDPPSRYFSSQL